ncbi:TrkA C-terminal domain-containing protein [Haloarcula saliterrae]|uniref:TrkA C-terminal domain-containing protein n=1 Tax=Haloarcula saliterrae TaxID=2950534 RepID=UPI003AAF9E89
MTVATLSATPLQGLALQGGSTATTPLQVAAQVLVIGIGAATAAGLVALGYRWYVRERVPTGLGVLFGLSVVAVSLIPTGALGQVILGDDAVLGSQYVLRNLAAFALGALGSSVGIRVGDAVGTDLFAATGGRTVNADVSDIVQTVGRVTSVRLPSDIDDIVGYDPMPDKTKEGLAGKRFLFPRRLTKTELRERLVTRLKTDYGVGHVDVELDDDGDVTYIGVGSRAAGIGPTLPPATNAVAVRADPANATSAGDLVQVWDTDPFERVVTGELRGVADDVVTVAIDAADTPRLDPSEEYKLVTLPVQDRPDREFASLLRAADETMGTVTVPAGSELVGTPVGELGVTVAAITRPDGPPEPIPSRDRPLAAGDVVYAIATPEALRRVEAAAGRQREVTDETTDGGEPSDGDLVAEGGSDADAGASDEETPATGSEGAAGDSDAAEDTRS